MMNMRARLIMVIAIGVVSLSLTLTASGARAQDVDVFSIAGRLHGVHTQDPAGVLSANEVYTVYLPSILRLELLPSMNLLYNGGLEGAFQNYQNKDRLIVANGWAPWSVKQRSTDIHPEWKRATLAVDATRIYSGESAQQYFSFWSTHIAALYQRVMVPSNAQVRFSARGQAWSSSKDPSRPSVDPTDMHMRIGIDPRGGLDPLDPGVVWSDEQNAIDAYVPFSVTAMAQGGRVTVFMYSAPDEPRKHNDVYWDDAELVTLSTVPDAPREPNPDAAILFTPSPPAVGTPMTISVSSVTPLTFVDLHVLLPDGADIIPPYAGDRYEGGQYVWEWNYTPGVSGLHKAVFLADGIAPAWADIQVP
jgi:hypothetical protein